MIAGVGCGGRSARGSARAFAQGLQRFGVGQGHLIVRQQLDQARGLELGEDPADRLDRQAQIVGDVEAGAV